MSRNGPVIIALDNDSLHWNEYRLAVIESWKATARNGTGADLPDEEYGQIPGTHPFREQAVSSCLPQRGTNPVVTRSMILEGILGPGRRPGGDKSSRIRADHMPARGDRHHRPSPSLPGAQPHHIIPRGTAQRLTRAETTRSHCFACGCIGVVGW